MSRKWKIGIPLFLLTIILTTVFFGRVETKQFSAYAACRQVALETKGYSTWKHARTDQMVFVSWVVFYDGYNDLTCQAVGIGPFWTAGNTMHTLVGCATSLSSDAASACPEEYFGVSP